MDNIIEQKRQWRSHMKAKRKQLHMETFEGYCTELNHHLITFVQTYKPQSIKGFIPYANEPNIWPFIHYCWQHSIIYIVPKCDTKTKQMDWFAIENKEQLVQGAYSILEPDETICQQVLSEPDHVLVPALAFTKKGERLGYGGGYYDRFYEKSSTQVKFWIGIAFQPFIVDQLPTEQHDFKCNYIVTNAGVIACKVEEKEDYDGIHSF